MASLDELIVKIKGDISDFKKKIEQASTVAKTGFSKISSSMSSMSSGFNTVFDKISQFRGAISAVLAAGGLATLVKSSIDTASALYDLSVNTGISTDTLQGLGYAASQSGVQTEAFNGAMLKLNRNVAEAAEGSESAKKAFSSLGVVIKNTDGSLRSTDDILFDVADGLQTLGSEAEQASALAALFGREGTKMLALFAGGSKGLNDFNKQAQDLGLILDKDLVAGAEQAGDSIETLQQVVSMQFTKAVVEAAPAIQKFAEALTSVTISGASFFAQFANSKELLEGINKRMDDTAFGFRRVDTAQQDAAAAGEKFEMALKKQSMAGLEANKIAMERRKLLMDAQKAMEQEAAKQEEIGKIVTAVGLTKEQQIQREIDLLEGRNETIISKEDMLKNAIMSKRAELEEMKNANNLSEINRTFERISYLQELDAEANAKEIEDLTAHIETKKAMLTDLDKFKTDSKLKDVKETKETAEKMNEIDKWLRSEQGQNFSSTMQFLQQGARSGNKELATIAKAAAITQATIDTYKGVAAALGSGPPPLNFILAAAVGAVGAANVAKIASTPIELNSGVTDVPGIGRGDRVPAMLEPGERVISRAQNSDLKKFMAGGGGGGGTQVILGFKDGLDSLIEVVETKLIERRNLSVGEGAI